MSILVEHDVDLDDVLALLRHLYVELNPERRASACQQVDAIAERYKTPADYRAQQRERAMA